MLDKPMNEAERIQVQARASFLLSTTNGKQFEKPSNFYLDRRVISWDLSPWPYLMQEFETLHHELCRTPIF